MAQNSAKRRNIIVVNIVIVVLVISSFAVLIVPYLHPSTAKPVPAHLNLDVSMNQTIVLQGSNLQVEVNVTSIGKPENVTLESDTGSSGITSLFSPAIGATNYTSLLALNVPDSTSAGDHSVVVIASTGKETVNTSFTVAVSRSDDWPMFNHDLAHTGYSRSSAPKTNQTLWTFTTADAVESSPAVTNGMVFFGSDDGFVYALNAANGSLVWKYNTYGPVQSSPAVVNGVVYIGGFHSHAVFALNAYTGELIWSSPTTSVWPLQIFSPAVANGLVYITVCNTGNLIGRLYALNASTGNLTWSHDTSFSTNTSPAVYGDKVFVGGSANYIDALNATSGAVAWSTLCNGAYYGYSSLLVSDGLVYVGTEDATVQVLDSANGEYVRSGFTIGGDVYSTPAIAKGVVYVSTTVAGPSNRLNFGGVTALDAKTCALLWNHTLGSAQQSSPAIADGTVFVGSDSGPLGAIGNHFVSFTTGMGANSIYALNGGTGATIWTYTTGGAVYSSPAVAYGAVYVGSNDGKVYAIGDNPNNIPTPTPTQPTPTARPR